MKYKLCKLSTLTTTRDICRKAPVSFRWLLFKVWNYHSGHSGILVGRNGYCTHTIVLCGLSVCGMHVLVGSFYSPEMGVSTAVSL